MPHPYPDLLTADGRTVITVHERVTGAALRRASNFVWLRRLGDQGRTQALVMLFDDHGNPWSGGVLAIEILVTSLDLSPRHVRMLDAATRLACESAPFDLTSVHVDRGIVSMSIGSLR